MIQRIIFKPETGTKNAILIINLRTESVRNLLSALKIYGISTKYGYDGTFQILF
jgi:hypothetical protein